MPIADDDPRQAGLRSLVADSWLRSSAAGVDPDRNLPPVVFEPAEVADYRSAHPLSQVFPLLFDVLGRAATDCDCIMAVADAHGRLLWVCGPNGVLRRAERIHFVEGSVWDENNAGTNAPGLSLHLDAPALVHASEHFTRLVQPWSCAAAPIHDPQTSEILGLVDITGGPDVATPQSLAMVRAAARMAESELARIGAERAATRAAAAEPSWYAVLEPRRSVRLEGLGRPGLVATLGDRTLSLSPRHSEILAVLVDHARGLTAEQLEVEVYAESMGSSTMRAEMARLRGLLGPEVLRSRPYRLVPETTCDWRDIGALVSAGRVSEAVRRYAGPLLPLSEAPGVATRRESLQARLRAAVIASGDPTLMVAWTRSRWGAEDLEMWQTQAAALPTDSPLRAVSVAEAARIERDLLA